MIAAATPAFAGAGIIAETNGTAATAAATLREYVWLPEAEIAPTVGSRTVVDMPVAVVDGVNLPTPATWMVHTDHLHRPIRMTDAARVAVWQATWQPFGAPYQITGSAVLDARFPGQWFQLEAGLHYNWHRSYDASLGRYTQPDPLGFVDGPSVYGYARSSPGRYVDKDGRKLPPSHERCIFLKQKIANFDIELCTRNQEYIDDILQLPERISPGEKLSETRRGHRTLIRMCETQKAKWEEKYKQECDDNEPPLVPPGAPSPFPSSLKCGPSCQQQTKFVAVLTAAGAIVWTLVTVCILF